MADLKSVSDYETICFGWIKALIKLIQEQKSMGKVVVLVAMSRKMPRLIEAIMKKMKKRGELSTDEIDTYNSCLFITEHVLPYILWDFDPEKQCVVIVDDAIYYGSTINQITGYIYYIINNGKKVSAKPYVIPVAVNEMVASGGSFQSKMQLMYADMQLLENTENVIKEKNIPFFTTQIAKDIISLCRPLDMEFPILRFNRSGTNDKEKDLHETLEKHFQDVYVYDIRHHVRERENNKWNTITNYNVLPKEGSKYDQWNNDFCKMRFFVSDESIQVVAFAPGALSEEAFTSEQPLFSDNRIQDMWDKVRKREMAKWPEDGNDDPITRSKRNAYEIQCARSKVIWANYLASFIYLLKHKETILKTISDVYGNEVSTTSPFYEDDTRQMLPPELVSSITASLNSCFLEWKNDEDCTFNSEHSAVLACQELIPEEYKAEYMEMNRKGLQRSNTAEEALSVMFSNQQLITNGGKMENDSLRRSLRLRFGITYNALVRKLAFPIGIKELWYNVHRWIDDSIDEGTVKPLYELVVLDGRAYWIRVFRAGENENPFSKMRRLCEFIIEKLKQKEIRSYVERSSVEDLLTLALEDPCNVILHTYKWEQFAKEKKKDSSLFYVTYKSKDDKPKNFVDFLIKQDYLQTSDSSGVERLSTIDDRIRIDTPLEALQEQAIADYIDVYYFYKKTRFQSYIMNNFFPQKRFEDDTKELINWCEIFSNFIGEHIKFEPSQDTQPNDFDDLDNSLNLIIQRTMKVENIAVDNSGKDNKNKTTIQLYLQKEEKNEDYNKFKDKLLSALVVKELFKNIFVRPEHDREERLAEIAEAYLNFIKEDSNDSNVILNFVGMSDENRQAEEKRKELVLSLQNILYRRVIA